MKATIFLSLLLLPLASLLAAETEESRRDKARAATLLAEAEGHSEQGDRAAALRSYQRAWRWDPSSVAPLEKIVPAALRLGRIEEAARYVLLDDERADPALLRRLAQYLAETGQWADALQLYRTWLGRFSVPGDANQELPEEAVSARSLASLEVARLEYLVGDVESASRSFERVQTELLANENDKDLAGRLREALGGTDASFWEIIGCCHQEAGRPRLASAAFIELSQSPEAAPRADYWLAELAAERGEPLVAYERLKRYFDADGESLGDAPYQLLGRVLRGLNDRQGLRTDLQRMQHPQRPYAKAAWANILADEGDFTQAETLHRELLTAAAQASGTSQFPAQESLTVVDEALVQDSAAWMIRNLAERRRLWLLGRELPVLGTALEDFEPLEADLRQAMADRGQGRRLLARLEAWKPADRTLGELLAGAWVARVGERTDLATALHREAVLRSGDDGPRRALAWALNLLFDDQHERAAEALQWGLEQNLWSPGEPEPYYYLATALAMAGKANAAVAAAREAASRAPDMADIVSHPAWVLFRCDRNEEATSEYREFVEAFDEDPDSATRASLKAARMTLSYLASDAGDAASAQEWLEQVLDEYPEEPGALNDLAYLWAERGAHLARAEKMARRAVAAEPSNAAYLDTLGWAQHQRGADDQALATIDRALRVAEEAGEPADGEILEHRGDILAALGRTEEANAAWRRSAEAYESAGEPGSAAAVRKKATASAPVP